MDVYFAGKYVHSLPVNGPYPPEKVFRICCNKEKLIPWLTKHPNGLIGLSHDANLYLLSEDGTKAKLIRRVSGRKDPMEVELTEAQQEVIRKAIDQNYFF